jgi:hypothetical protein
MAASGMVAREVLGADAANLLPNILRAGQGRRSNAHRRRQSGWGVRLDCGCQTSPGTGQATKTDRVERSAWGGDEVKSARERAEEKREAKLELVREQVQNGSLVIRQMTKEERRRYPRRPVSPKRAGGR